MKKAVKRTVAKREVKVKVRARTPEAAAEAARRIVEDARKAPPPRRPR